MKRKMIVLTSLIAGVMLLSGATAQAGTKSGNWGPKTFGATTLEVDPGTLGALTSLGVAPGVVSPAKLDGATYAFPIVNPLPNALRTGSVRHVGGISLTAGSTRVELTNFEIKLGKRLLYGKVNGAGPVPLLDLDYSGTSISLRRGVLKIGPVGTTLTAVAADALNDAFETDALSDETPIGTATIRYRLFG